LKQLLFILTTTSDGFVLVQFRCEDGNRNDSPTHLATWATLRQVAGRADFLYVADSKLCAAEAMETIASRGGRFVTVLPRTRKEDEQFRRWVQEFEPQWEKVRDWPNPRRKYGPRDVWFVYRHPVPSRENWPVTWIYSTLLRAHKQRSRQDKITRAKEELDQHKSKLERKGAKKRSVSEVDKKIQKIVTRLHVSDYVRAWVYEYEEVKFRQKGRGRPGPNTDFSREVRKKPSIAYEIDHDAIAYDMKSDGMYPLLTNDRSLTPK